MADGGCIDDGPDGANNQNSCALHPFKGADFPYLAANVKYAGTNNTILPAYTVKNIKGAKIGFIGMTLKDTPTIVTASGVAGLEFTDEVQTANALVPVLRSQGVNAIVVLIHQGGTRARRPSPGPNSKPYTVETAYDCRVRQGGSRARRRLADHPHRQGPRPGHRHGRLGPHAPAVRLRHPGPGRPGPSRHLGVVVRSPLHRDER